MKSKSQGVGLLGGTFDPPHLGHLILAATAAEQLGLEQVLFLPVGQPTHKTSLTPAAHRIAMTNLAIADHPRFELDLSDIQRPQPHFTVDLLPILSRRLPGTALWLLLGGDSLRDLPTWHQPQRLIARCRLAVLNRPGAHIDWVDLERAIPGLVQRVVMLDGPLVTISSTALRRGLAAGRRFEYVIQTAVRQYIDQHRLYFERDQS